MKQIRTVLYAFDLFGTPVKLLQKERTAYNTLLGSSLSIAIIVFTLISFINMVKEMFSRESPNIVSTLQFTPNPEFYIKKFILEPDNFFLGIGFGDKTGVPFINQPNYTIFRSYVKACTQNTTITKEGKNEVKLNCTIYDMNLCSHSNIDEDFKQVFQFFIKYLQSNQIQMKNNINILTVLIQPNGEKNQFRLKEQCHQLFGLMLIQLLKTARIQLTTIVIQYFFNKIIVGCAPQEVIDAKMATGFAAIMTMDNLLNQKQPGNPFQPINKAVITTSSTKNSKYFSYYYRHSITQTDENFFYYFNEQRRDHVLQLESQFETQNAASNEIIHVSIYLDDKVITYFRTYDNLLNILGNTSGLMQTLAFLIGIFLNPMTNLLQNVSLANSIFSFEESPNSNSQVTPLNMKRSSYQSVISIKQVFSKNEQTLSNMKQPTKILKKFLTQKDKKFKMCTLFCIGRRKKQLEQGISSIDQKLDITFIIKKLIEVDRLKMLLLSSEQLKLFDYVMKPTIGFDRKSSNIFFQQEKSDDKKVIEALEAYLISKEQQDEKTAKLLEMMDIEIKNLFDEIIMNERLNIDCKRKQIGELQIEELGSIIN